ncbi:MAG: hypothetical protein FJ387_10075 [Verrucomicrobia bacterium]|nr:hypothetical protein [Verrucomicrobiota bacterium]
MVSSGAENPRFGQDRVGRFSYSLPGVNARTSWKRKAWWAVVASLLGVGVIVAALPLWFPWLARPLARQAGVTWDTYSRLGYTRGGLRGLRAQFGTVSLEATEAQLCLPPRWLIGVLGGGTPPDPFVEVTGWRLAVASEPLEPSQPSSTNSTAATLELVDGLLPAVRRWLPHARLTGGLAVVGDEELAVPQVTWRSGRLTGVVQSTRYGQDLSLSGNFVSNGAYRVTARVDPLDVELDLGLARPSQVWELAGALSWRSNQAQLSARFGTGGYLPESARVVAEAIRLPAQQFELAGYDTLEAGLAVEWLTNRFAVELDAQARPERADSLSTPPLEVALQARGDLQSAALEALDVRAPWVRGALAGPVTLHWEGRPLREPAEFRLTADLASLPVTNLAGRVEGRVRVQPQDTQPPAAELTLQGQGLSALGLRARDLSLVSRLVWPVVELEPCAVRFEDDSTFTVGARLDLDRRVLTGGHWAFSGDLLESFLPTNISYATLAATGQFSGLLTRPSHAGEVSLSGLNVPGLAPSEARLAWGGEALDVDRLNVSVSAGPASWRLRGALRASLTNGPQVELVLQEMDWERAGQAVYRLAQPCAIAARQTPGERQPAPWEVQVGELQWQGEDRAVRLAGTWAWPERGRTRLELENLRPSDFIDLVPAAALDVTIAALDLDARWMAGPMDFAVELAGQVPGLAEGPCSARAKLAGNENGVQIEELTVTAPSLPTLSLAGRVPLVIAPAGGSLQARLHPEIPFGLQAHTAPVASVARALGELGNVTLVAPELRLELAGNATDLKGGAHLRVDRLEWRPPNATNALPAIEQIKLEARLEPDRLELEELSLRWGGQRALATGVWPLGPAAWTNLLERGAVPDWKQARGRLTVAEADLAALAGQLPGRWLTQGQLWLDAALSPGGVLAGELRVTNAATAPLPAMGAVRDLDVLLRVQDQTVSLVRLRSRVGTAPLTAQGEARFAPGKDPVFSGTVVGENVPLIRQTGLIIRSDLDLRLATAPAQPPTLSGEVRLRDSLFLQPLELLVPGPGTDPSQRPPYFRIPAAPLKDWKLDLKIAGDRFLRLRTPVLVGLASADLRLQGTLGDPVALGEARIPSGKLTFPFGSLAVDSGFVMLNSSDPHRPRLALHASGTVYGYAIQMDVSGPADDPQVLLSSTPPLSSGQILLLLTAGELPRDSSYFSRSDRAEKLMMFLGKDVLSRVVGSEDAQERLTISSGQHISQSGKSTYSVEYRLTERWSLVGEYDRFDALNAHVKWRVYSR